MSINDGIIALPKKKKLNIEPCKYEIYPSGKNTKQNPIEISTLGLNGKI